MSCNAIYDFFLFWGNFDQSRKTSVQYCMYKTTDLGKRVMTAELYM